MSSKTKINMRSVFNSGVIGPSEAMSARRYVLSDLRAQEELRQIAAELAVAASRVRSKALRNVRRLNLGVSQWILGDLKEALKALGEVGGTAPSRYFQAAVLLEM